MSEDSLDSELRAVALLCLRNAFWHRFSELCNDYIDAAEGLGDLDGHTEALGDLASVYGRSDARGAGVDLVVHLAGNRRAPSTTTLAEALRNPKAVAVYLNDRKVLERVSGEWMYVEL